MQILKFQELAEAYGGDIARWPVETQGHARMLLANDPSAARALQAASDIDLLLDLSPSAHPSVALRDALIAAAPRARFGVGGFDWRGLFLPGAGLAAAGLAGLIVGVMLSLQAAETARTDDLVDSAIVGNTATDDSGLPLTVSQALPVGQA